jgi:transcriptional regulator with XRE-family HTH domain
MSDTYTLSERVAEEIRAMLGRRRMSGRQLATKLGVSQTWMSTRLTGTTPIDLNDLERIAAILDVEVAELLPIPKPGRYLTTVGFREAPNDCSARPAIRPTRRRIARIPCPKGGTRPEPTAPASPVSPTQRRPMLASAPGQRIAA